MPAKPTPRPGPVALVTLLLALLWSGVPSAPIRAEEPAPSAPARSLDPALQRALDTLRREAAAMGGQVGVAVVDLESGERLVDHRGTELHNPASNMKIVTAWALLRERGPAHRFLTALRGRREGSRVARLVLRGDGDPSFDVRHLYDMAASLRRAGIREVGDVVVDQSAFDGVHVPPGFAAQPGEWAAFRAPVAAVSLAHNTILVEVRPGQAGSPASVSVVPPSFVAIEGRVTTSEADRPEKVELALSASGDRLRAVLGGSIPEDAPRMEIRRRVDDPTLLAGHALADVLRELQIAVTGKVLAGRAERAAPVLAEHASEPLALLVHGMGKYSNNFYAEMLFKSLSAGPGRVAAFDASVRRLEAMLDEAGVARRGAVFHNGSGLFDGGVISPLTLAELLREAHRDPRVSPELTAQLSVAGVDGTLRHRLTRWRASRSVRGKTGTLAAVSALSGYVLRPGGGGVAFSVIANDVSGRAISMRKPIDAFVDRLAQQTLGQAP
ncbi:MAG: D-alanyl-D-alanine carboxypeptidase/D-alanyl-D-alanine-endopeptidase [Polyangiaceae bacterium]